MFGLLNGTTFELKAQRVDMVVLVMLFVALAWTVNALGWVFYPGFLDRVVAEDVRGHPRQSVGQIMRTLPYGRLLVADIVFVAAVGVASAFFVLPGLIVFTLFSLVGPMITIEDQSVLGAFRRSFRLVKPHFAVVFLLVAIPIGFEEAVSHAVEELAHHQPWIVRCIEHGLAGAIVGSVVGLIEVHLAFILSGAHPDDDPVHA